jgi:hypothetical protein
MMHPKKIRSIVSILSILFIVVTCVALLSSNALANGWDLCGDSDEFTAEFLIDDCQFKTVGANPYFILTPGYQKILEEEEERSIETVLCETKTINLNGRQIQTRVYEERAQEWEEGEGGEPGEWVTVEISMNWFAICKQTNDVYYFGEWSRDCEEGFDENDECEEGESNEGSWEAGVNDAMPGIIMPGTFLLGAKYFQEYAPLDDAVDRGENVEMGLSVDVPAGEWSDCVKVIDTNPAEDECGDDDAKTYCYGVGLVQDEDMELVEYGFAGCNNYLPDDEEEE